MFVQLSLSLSGISLLIAAGIGCYAGNYARRSSVLARDKGIPLGIVLTILLALDGWQASDQDLTSFLGSEFLTLTAFAFIFVGIASIGLIAIEGFFHTFISSPWRRIRQVRSASRQDRERELRRQQARELEMLREAQWEAARPERERLAREEAKRVEESDERKLIDAERRQSARQKLLLCYHQHSPHVQDSVSWERFQEYIVHYLADSLTADQVEANAERMIETITGFFEESVAAQVYRSVTDISRQYDIERKEIMDAGYSDDKTAAMLADVNFREDQALMEQRQ